MDGYLLLLLAENIPGVWGLAPKEQCVWGQSLHDERVLQGALERQKHTVLGFFVVFRAHPWTMRAIIS